ncbi:hypothetical protein GCM10010302_75680 [Streptomyces polychromogenes]|uniref:Uncharacterized protein n=1 Tax=Streptomyces polychromogenes TaxID=67342 RepID=A0ABN0W527_9ACTN
MLEAPEAEEARRRAEADEQRRLAALSAACDRTPGGGRSGPARIWPAGAWMPRE